MKTSFLSPAKSSSATPSAHQYFLLALWLNGFSAKWVLLASEANHSASTNNSTCPLTQADTLGPTYALQDFSTSSSGHRLIFRCKETRKLCISEMIQSLVTQKKRGPYLSSQSWHFRRFLQQTDQRTTPSLLSECFCLGSPCTSVSWLISSLSWFSTRPVCFISPLSG